MKANVMRRVQKELPPPSAILFDWGGTIAEYIGRDATKAVDHTSALVVPECAHDVSSGLNHAISTFWSNPDGARLKDFEAIVEKVIIDVGIAPHEWLVRRYVTEYLAYLSSLIKHDPSARSILSELSQSGVPLGLISNTLWPASWHDWLLERDGLLEFLPVRIYSTAVGVHKPHPKIFEAARHALRVKDPRTIYLVGDRLDQDVQGGHKAGMTTVWLRNNHDNSSSNDAPDLVIDDLKEVASLVERKASD